MQPGWQLALSGLPCLSMYVERLFCTVGVHPTRCGEIKEYPGGEEAYMALLQEVLAEGKALGKVVALGECGLGELILSGSLPGRAHAGCCLPVAFPFTLLSTDRPATAPLASVLA